MGNKEKDVMIKEEKKAVTKEEKKGVINEEKKGVIKEEIKEEKKGQSNGLKQAEQSSVHIKGKPYNDLPKAVNVKSLIYYVNRVIGLGSSHTIVYEG